MRDKQTEYSKKLLDPRWQKKRLEILQRDEFTCQQCFDDKKTLHVHHRRYFTDCEPWEYEDCYLVTLCESCHEEEQGLWPEVVRSLTDTLCRKGYFTREVMELEHALEFAPGNPQYFLDLIYFLTLNKEAYELLSTRFCESVRTKGPLIWGHQLPARQASE